MRAFVVFTILAGLVAVNAPAGLVTEYEFGTTAGQTNLAVDLGTGIAADAGDVIVFAIASSQSYIKNLSVTSPDSGVVSARTDVWPDKNATVAYYSVLTGGTFDLSVDGNDQTFDTYGAYVIGSDLGLAVFSSGSAQNFVGANVSTTNTLAYGSLTTPSGNPGIVVEAAVAGPGWVSYPEGYSVFENSGQSRSSAWGWYTAGDVSSTYISSDITKNSRTVGLAFAEVIPEPATVGLVALGALALMARRRRD